MIRADLMRGIAGRAEAGDLLAIELLGDLERVNALLPVPSENPSRMERILPEDAAGRIARVLRLAEHVVALNHTGLSLYTCENTLYGGDSPWVELLETIWALKPRPDAIPVHVDSTGTTREPPHCPTCQCGGCL